MDSEVLVRSRDFWFKVVDMLQQNWALVDADDDGSAVIYFVSDTSDVFDRLSFASVDAAMEGLLANGFRRFAEDAEAQSFIRPPDGPFGEGAHPNGPIYSSGRFWR